MVGPWVFTKGSQVIMKILLVNWGTETAEFPLKESIKLRRHEIYLATTNRISGKIKKLFPKNRLIYTNPYNQSLLIENVVKFCNQRKIKFDVVTTFFEMNVYQTAILADYLECRRRLPATNALQTSVNKYLMRMKLFEAGIRQPRFLYFTQDDIGKAFKFSKKIGMPVVIKPVHSGHSYGTRLVNHADRKEFEKLFKECLSDFSKDYDEWMNYFNKDQATFLI